MAKKPFNPSTQAHTSEVLPLRSTTATTHRDIIAGHCFIDTLPFEVLSEIFCYSLQFFWEVDGFHDYVMSISLASPPLSLISVCKLWRGVALATPSLWDSILPSFNSIPCINAWMKVLPDQPFHLMLTQCRHDFTRVNPHYACELFQLFSTVSHRWKSLSIQLDNRVAEEFLSFLQANIGNPIPIKDIYMSRATFDTSETTMKSIISLLPLSTSVERLYWDGYSFTTSAASLLPWKQLKTVKVEVKMSTTQDVFTVLSQCTSASVVGITMWPTNLEYDQTPMLYHDPPILLPLLTSLQLSRRTDPMALLQYFTFPSLHNLWIEVAHRDLFAFRNFLRRTPLLEILMIDESGQDQSGSPDGPSEQDIIDYLGIPELCNIPSFKLTFRDAHTVTVSIIEDNPNALNLPPLLCWRDYWLGSRYVNCSFIGWGNHWFTKDLIWEYRQGKLEFTSKYHSKWYHWRDSTWDQPGGNNFRRPPAKSGPFKCIPLPPP